MTQYDAIVIGAGNGGLIAAIKLAHENKKVLLIEQHNLPGGVATSFRRGRFEFDATLHEMVDIGSAENPGDVRTMLESLGIHLNWVHIPDLYRVIGKFTDGSPMDVTMPAGEKNFLQAMNRYVPEAKEEIHELFRIMRSLNNLPILYHCPKIPFVSAKTFRAFSDFMKYGHYKTLEVFHRLHLPQRAIDILSTYWSYLGVSIEEINFLHYSVMLYGYISDEAYIPEHNSFGLATALLEKFRELGGRILLSTKAERIMTSPMGSVYGVRTDRGVFYSNHVIFNGNPSVAHKNLVNRKLLGELQQKMLYSRKFSSRPFVVYLGLNKSAEELGIRDYSIFLPAFASSREEYQSMKEIATNHYCIGVCPNVVNPLASPEGTCILSMTTIFSANCWSKVSIRDYKKNKEALALRMIQNYEEKTGIQLQPYIEEISIATPWTYYRYTGAPEGCGYGYEVGSWDNVIARYMTKHLDSSIKGLEFCGGGDAYGNGYSTSQISGLMAAQRVLKKL